MGYLGRCGTTEAFTARRRDRLSDRADQARPSTTSALASIRQGLRDHWTGDAHTVLPRQNSAFATPAAIY